MKEQFLLCEIPYLIRIRIKKFDDFYEELELCI